MLFTAKSYKNKEIISILVHWFPWLGCLKFCSPLGDMECSKKTNAVSFTDARDVIEESIPLFQDMLISIMMLFLV